MKIRNNLFELAEIQLQKELEGNKIKDYSMIDVIDRAVIIRKELDRLDRIGKIKNIHTKKLQELYTNKEKRHLKYLKTGK
jgi:hypothetical protein